MIGWESAKADFGPLLPRIHSPFLGFPRLRSDLYRIVTGTESEVAPGMGRWVASDQYRRR
jgi:hypothetical protein